MRGFCESDHAEYLNNDKNLLNLDFLVLAETWLDSGTSNQLVINKINNWIVVKRLDATDGGKHMGLMLIHPKSKMMGQSLIFSMDYVEERKMVTGKLLYQGIIIQFKEIYRQFVFLYIRETPNEKETADMSKKFENLDGIIGDLNLDPEMDNEDKKIRMLCGDSKVMSLKEITTVNFKQLDHILLDLDLDLFQNQNTEIQFTIQ